MMAAFETSDLLKLCVTPEKERRLSDETGAHPCLFLIMETF